MDSPSPRARTGAPSPSRQSHLSELFELPRGAESIFPYRRGYSAYVWVTTPIGTRERKAVTQ